MRQPAAIGFYPGDKIALRNELKKFLVHNAKKYKAIGAIVPHAGYMYSGKVAGITYSSIETDKRTFMIFCPNHTGYGSRIALSQENWITPLGIVKTKRFLKLEIDENAHLYEHAIEVQLPFLQTLYKDFDIIPVCLSHLSLREIEELSKRLVDENLFYIASSDFTHFGHMYNYIPINKSDKENLEYVENIDKKAIELICSIEPEKFYNFVVKNNMTICGFIPITLLLFITRQLDAKEGKLIKYSTSYEVSKGSSFVSYAGILIV
ncbi:MAG: AmmeMemoRadiSam system protein B [Candidatus Aenigmatarchaeota archaeon]